MIVHKHLFVGLRPIETQHAAKTANQLVLQIGDLNGIGCAQAVDQDKSVNSVARDREIVDAHEDAVVLAGQRRTRACAVDCVDHGAVSVVNHGHWLARGRWLDIRRQRDSICADGNIRAVHVFGETAL